MDLSKGFLFLAFMNGCPYCKGLDGKDGLLAKAATEANVPFCQAERQDGIINFLNDLQSDVYTINSFPTIAYISKTKWKPLPETVPRDDLLQMKAWLLTRDD